MPDAPMPQALLHHNRANVPAELVGDDRIWAQGRVLYGILQLLPTYERRAGQCTYRELCDLTHLSLNTIKKAVRELVNAGWLQITQQHKQARICYRLTYGASTADAIEIGRMRRRLNIGPRGEALMREWLSLLVPSTDYLDNARPGDFTNPLTGQPLELDRRYGSGVAFEFNGEQHDRPSARFPVEEVMRQQGRDLIKKGLCMLLGIKLAIVKDEDLSLEGMRRKIGDLLPVRDLTGHDRLVAFLEDESWEYRQKAFWGRQSENRAE
ncbi:MAG: winged helix-turn-helix transcriptional regulator [Mycobacterium leprae]